MAYAIAKTSPKANSQKRDKAGKKSWHARCITRNETKKGNISEIVNNY